MKKLVLASLIAGFASFAAQAESNSTNTASSVAANLKFSVVIPKVMMLQVGSTGGTQDTLLYTVDANKIGDASLVTAASSGETTNGAVPVRIMSNAGGTLRLNNSVTELRQQSGSATIPWQQIEVTSTTPTSPATGFTAATIAHPAFTTNTQGSGTESVIQGSTNGTIKQEGLWTFKYKNATAPLAGTYNGTATYTLAAQ